ncbi:FAD-binding-3 domain-containing protein [Mycena indigotica]|uniref:FAD-binding-3 domain-containing protein n=1 Tax=Mycena indigotica TaxID=2126181 RepID=A0A8H6T1T0_9AGAR|nr:FAD-binding-3 domain-containing protein [Mycena indigotica]KAF7309285.1 FAD-binding-3 domain-containing protein [Mycena indigotica]
MSTANKFTVLIVRFHRPLNLLARRLTVSTLQAGAGPAGLVLALLLLRSGISVRIIDKEQTHRVGSRGAGVQSRTLELYAQLGLYDKIIACGGDIPNIALYKPGKENTTPMKEFRLTPLVDATPSMPYPNTMNIPQDAHEAVLREALAALGCTVELGVELASFEQQPDFVRVTLKRAGGDDETAEVAWLVGADGAHSVVRKGLGLSFLGETHEEQEMFLGDIEIEGVTPGLWHMWADPRQTIVLRGTTPTSNVYTFACLPGASGPLSGPFTRDEFVKIFYDITQRTDISFGSALWLSHYRANIRMVDEMRVGRVFVVGDAAHCHSPAGGQGLNSSVQDSANLAWKLALVIKNLAPDSLLDTYAEERLRVIAQMLKLTTLLHNTTHKMRQQPNSDAAESATAGGRRKHAELSMLGVNYCGSSIIAENDDADKGLAPAYTASLTDIGALPGYRAPEAPGLAGEGEKETSLFAVFDLSKHTILLFGDALVSADALGELRLPAGTTKVVHILPTGVALEKVGRADVVLQDTRGHAYATYGIAEGETALVVVRPDGVVGAVEGGSVKEAVAGVGKYFSKILGSEMSL